MEIATLLLLKKNGLNKRTGVAGGHAGVGRFFEQEYDGAGRG